MNARELRAQRMREAFPLPIVTVVVDETTITEWLRTADPETRANYDAMVAAGMVDVRDTRP